MSDHLGINSKEKLDWYKPRAADSLANPPGLQNVNLATTLDAAENLIQKLRLAENENRRDVLARECRGLLDQAERIQAVSGCQPSGKTRRGENSTIALELGLGSKPKKPEARKALTTREKIILLEGSRLHGFVFPPWTSPPSPSEFELSCGESLYLDNPEPLLSDVQRAIFAGWKRPAEAFPLSCLQQPALFPNSNPTMVSEGRIDLVQDVTADCSVVASLCAITARKERGHSKMISSIMYPYNHHLFQPELSPNGKYIFRMYFNGCFRKVTIDDRLPTSRSEQTLHVIDRNNPGLLWPALIEKAYLKVRGGYDFPGSNSGTDIWALTSWIPEQIFFQRYGFKQEFRKPNLNIHFFTDQLTRNDILPDALWRRIYGAFSYGDVLITVGTGGLTQSEEVGIGLTSDHDYAIIDMKEIGDQRLCLVKNPWAGGSTWKRPVCHSKEITSVLDAQDARILKNERPGAGTFWMDLKDISLNFESMYLNWNPGLFCCREDVHFTWHMLEPRAPCGSFGSNPQFEVRSENGGTIWLLLSRHFQEITTLSRNCQSEGLPSTSGNNHGFICLYAFDNDGTKVFLSDGAYCRGVYVDSPNTLIKLELLPAKGYTIVVSEQSLPQSKYNFTLSALSIHPLSISKARDIYSHWVRRQSAWTTSSSGGNSSSATYHLNPQFGITIPAMSDISLLLEATNEDIPVHVKLLWGDGKFLSTIRDSDIVGDSGEYRKGFAVADIRKVQPGIYTIICSTFEGGQLGAFSLSIGATSDCTVKQSPKPNAGLLSLVVPTAAFGPDGNRLVAPLVAQRITRISLEIPWRSKVSKSTGGSGSLLKLAIEHGQGPNKQVLLVSGEDEFLDYGLGIRTAGVDIHPDMSSRRGLWVVLERLKLVGLSTKEEVVIEIHSDAPLEVGPWRHIDE